jgi:hypothetical protein
MVHEGVHAVDRRVRGTNREMPDLGISARPLFHIAGVFDPSRAILPSCWPSMAISMLGSILQSMPRAGPFD